MITVLHDLSLALQYADQVIVVDRGELTACGSPNDICLSGTIDQVFHIHTQVISSSQYIFHQMKGIDWIAYKNTKTLKSLLKPY